MCEFCENSKNMALETYGGMIKIIKKRFTPTGYQLVADNSCEEYGETAANIEFCPMCGRDLRSEENDKN